MPDRTGHIERVRHESAGRIPAIVRTSRAAVQLQLQKLSRSPVLRQLRCIQLRRLTPLAGGRQRGTPIVRRYWADFLNAHRSDIRGRALEIGTSATIRAYGGAAITQSDAIDLTRHSPDITVAADLARADDVPSDTYDCFVNQFTMHVIFDIESALYHSVRILKPGGVLLVNFPCLDYYFERGLDMRTGRPMYIHWWFTPLQVDNLLRRAGLSDADYALQAFGNLFSQIAHQANMSAEELTDRELQYNDGGYPLLICVRAVKPHDWRAIKPLPREPWLPDVTPASWNPVTGHYPG